MIGVLPILARIDHLLTLFAGFHCFLIEHRKIAAIRGFDSDKGQLDPGFARIACPSSSAPSTRRPPPCATVDGAGPSGADAFQDHRETALSIRMPGHVTHEAPGTVPGLAHRRADLDGGIELSDVTFRYPHSARPGLRDVSLRIEPGTIVGVVGRSGSGKTTLTRLIQGLYTPDSGAVRLSGVDLREFDPGELRRRIGVVLQDDFLFRRTVLENIALATPGAGIEQVKHAAMLAGAHEFIERLPQGYHTELDEQAADLSGGQRQRLAIARALVRDPRILILDEATSALDPESAAIVRQNLRRIARGRTVLIVSHRPAMLEEADRILVLDEGTLVGAGTHPELLHRCPIYAGSWRRRHDVAA